MSATQFYQRIHTRSYPLIRSFHIDLEKHDRATITENNARLQREFIHITYPQGTRLAILSHRDDFPAEGVRVPFLFGEADWSRLALLNIHMLPYYISKENLLWLHCQPAIDRITEITPQQCEQLIRKNYDDILRQNRARIRPAA